VTVQLAVIGGDGIGPEVVAEARKVLDVVLPGVTATEYDLGAARYHRTGEVLPDSVLEELAAQDVILLGAVGDPSVPSGVLERGLLLKLRFAFDHYVNLRPSKLWPGTTSPLAGVKPGEIDLVVVREGTARSPPRRASTRGTARSAPSATPSTARCAGRGAR
jgi:3-isopropylmalate dehydrogenase